MNIDDVLDDLFTDRQSTITEQLAQIEREITKRRLASAERSIILFDQIRELQEQILHLQPENDMTPDLQRSMREPLERERRLLERDLQDEIRDRWRDIQSLKQEQRQLLRERREQTQHYERHTGQYE